MTITIHGIQTDQIDAVWPIVRPWIASACDTSEWDESHILADLFARKQQLWIVQRDGVPTACVTSRIDVHRNGTRVLFIPTLAGEGMDVWLGPVVDLMTQFARAHRCTELRASGRRGWVRALKQHGARELSVTVGLEV